MRWASSASLKFFTGLPGSAANRILFFARIEPQLATGCQAVQWSELLKTHTVRDDPHSLFTAELLSHPFGLDNDAVGPPGKHLTDHNVEPAAGGLSAMYVGTPEKIAPHRHDNGNMPLAFGHPSAIRVMGMNHIIVIGLNTLPQRPYPGRIPIHSTTVGGEIEDIYLQTKLSQGFNLLRDKRHSPWRFHAGEIGNNLQNLQFRHAGTPSNGLAA